MVLFWPYIRDTPLATNKPSVDQPDMKDNTNNIDNFLSVDHFGFNVSNGGTHQQCQLYNVIGGNGIIPSGLQGGGFETIYSSETNGPAGLAGELWFVRGANMTGIQLTGPGTPMLLTRNYTPQSGGGPVGNIFGAGATFFAGGLLYQFGFFAPGTGNISPSTGTIKFPKTYADATSIIILLTAICKNGGTSASHTFSIIPGTTTTTQFQWNLDTSTTAYIGLNWMAIGN